MSMKHVPLFFVALAIILGAGLSAAQAPDTLWTRTYGGTSGDRGWSVVQTGDGGFAITGESYSFSEYYNDIYLIRADSHGDTVWTRALGTSLPDAAYNLCKTSDGGYVIAGYTGRPGSIYMDVYLIKTDAAGDTVWTVACGGTDDDQARCIQQTDDNGYIAVGHTESFGAGWRDIYLIRLNPNGDTLWARTYGGSSWEAGYSVEQTAEGGYIIAGETQSYGAGRQDMYLIKTDATGDTLWTKTFGGSDMEYVACVRQTADGGYILAGSTWPPGAEDLDIYIVKTDSAGEAAWTRTYGGTSNDASNHLTRTSDGGYAVAGWTESFGSGGKDAYIVKMDENGDTLWTAVHGGTGIDVVSSIVQTSDGGYAVAGWTGSFGAGGGDVYLIRIASEDSSGVGQDPRIDCTGPALEITPCPARSVVLIRCGTTFDHELTVTIYGPTGREVRVLSPGNGSIPTNLLRWDGTDSRGLSVSPGIYFCRLQAGDRATTRKIVLLR